MRQDSGGSGGGRERWAPIAGADGYEVSDLGRVRTCRPRNGLGGRLAEPRPVAGSVRKKTGYVFVRFLREGGGYADRMVHCLVLEAFVGPRPEGMETRHLDGVRANNALANLAWGTPAQNSADRARHGRHASGQDHANAKLTAEDVERMRRWRRQGLSYRLIAEHVGVCERTARDACVGATYRD